MGLSFSARRVTSLIVSTTLRLTSYPCRTRVGLLLARGTRVRRVGLRRHKVSHPASMLSFPVVRCRRPKSFSVVSRRDTRTFGPRSKRLVLNSVIVSGRGILSRTRRCKRLPGERCTFLVTRDVLRLFKCSRVISRRHIIVRTGRGRVVRGINVFH